METHPIRLTRGQDLKASLDTVARERGWPAVCVLSAVGSLTALTVRFAGRKESATVEGPLEILTLGGTLGPDGSHLHLAVSDRDGAVIGGHLLAGSPVFTTAEIVLGILPSWRFSRAHDPATGYRELHIERAPPPRPGSAQ